jgi:hypothetical protein
MSLFVSGVSNCMNLQPSTSTLFNDRRLLFSQELETGGHGQLYFSSAGTYTVPAGYVFYQVDFFSTTLVTNARFRNVNDTNTQIYSASNANYASVTFPAGYSWSAPLTSFTVGAGASGIAFMYKKFIPESVICM